MSLEQYTIKYYYWSDLEKFFIEHVGCNDSTLWGMWLDLYESTVSNNNYCTHWFDCMEMFETEFCIKHGNNGAKLLSSLSLLKSIVEDEKFVVYYYW